MPKFFQDHGRKEPTTRRGTIMACSQGAPELTVWELTMRDPSKTQVFMQAMQLIEAGYPFSGEYSFDWVVSRAAEDPARKLVVDVGGSSGHALKGIARETPGLELSRCVLQDLPPVVERAKAGAEGGLEKAEFMGIDFHEKQPVQG